MAEYQVTSWRDLPSLVTAREGDVVAKVPLPQRFQEAIDEAAMRLGETSSEAYLEGWLRGPWQPGDGEPTPLAHAVAAELEAQWPVEQVAAYLLALNPSST